MDRSIIRTTADRSTPCVGICSTTYGDLVCRGCKRFAHEIVEWNGFNADQQAVVWDRLDELRDGAVGQWLRVCDREALEAHAEPGSIAGRGEISSLHLAYQVLRTTRLPLARLTEIGVEALMPTEPDQWTGDLVQRIDQEFYARSVAHYEHNFKITAR